MICSATSLTHTHTHTRARTQSKTHTHMHTLKHKHTFILVRDKSNDLNRNLKPDAVAAADVDNDDDAVDDVGADDVDAADGGGGDADDDGAAAFCLPVLNNIRNKVMIKYQYIHKIIIINIPIIESDAPTAMSKACLSLKICGPLTPNMSPTSRVNPDFMLIPLNPASVNDCVYCCRLSCSNNVNTCDNCHSYGCTA